MVGIGIAEVLVVWFGLLPSFLGIPVGIPPGPEDPLMAQVAPERCLFYASWSGMGTADGSSTNRAEQVMAEPDLRRVVTAIDLQLKAAAAKGVGAEPERAATVMAEMVPQLLASLLSQAGAFYVSDLQVGPDGPEVRGALVLRLGETEREVKRLLDQLPLEGTRHRLHDGVSFRTLEMDGPARHVSWGIWRNCVVIGLGEEAVAELISRADGDPPTWFTFARQRLELPRVSSLSYLNLREVWRLAGETLDPELPEILAALGLDAAKSVMAVSGLDDTDFVSRTLVQVEGTAEGILGLLDAAPLAKADLRAIPRSAHAATVLKFDLSQLWDTLLDRLARVHPQAAEEMREGLRQIELGFGIDIHDDLLPSLGDTWALYTAPGNGGLLTGWTIAVSVDKPDRVRRIHEQLLGMFRSNVGPDEGEVRVVTVEGGEVHYLVTGRTMGMPFSPSWCLTESELILGAFPQAVLGHLENRTREEPLTTSVAWGRMWNDAQTAPLLASHVDLRPVFEIIYPLVQFYAHSAFNSMRQQGIDLDISLIPSAGVFTRHLGPAVGRAFRVAEGLELERRQPLPGGSLGGSLPVSLALLLPAVQSSREGARRAQGSNNLKQIGLAMHNHHDTHGSFPAAYTIDGDKKALLSWRVHLLPFLDELPLYNEFRLDEPWDSEHNRKLIERMPRVYAAPGSGLEPGKTNYVAPRGDRTVFSTPRDNQAGLALSSGTRMRDILDGTSNTIAVVEASDALGVVWTKPDDYDYDERDPTAGLVGLRGQGFMALLTDGSVRFISALIDPNILNALYTRDGGEVIPGF